MLSTRSLAVRPAVHSKIRRASVQASSAKPYFVATNHFKVKPENMGDFEEVWKTRESHLKETPGFIRFALLKCTNVEGEYISMSHWESPAAFEAWTKSPSFAKSHASQQPGAQAPQGPPRPKVSDMLSAPPAPKFYETVTITEL